MNKFLTKITGASLAIAMMIGVGAGLNYNKRANEVNADGDTWTATAAASLVTNDVVVIADKTSAKALLNSNGTNSAPTATAVTLNAGKTEITSTVPDTLKWTVTVTDSVYQFTKYNDTTRLYCTNTNNGVRVGTNDNNEFIIKSNFLFNSDTSRYVGVYNNADWRCYTTIHDNIKNTVLTFYKFTTSGGGDIPDPTDFTVSFNANGGSGTMDSVSEVSGSYTLPANGFTAPTGKVFIGWKANNAGNLIEVGQTYNVTANVTFFAQWENRYTVTYNANGGSGTITDSNSPYAPNATVTVMASTGFTAPQPDMVFDKWNTAANGSGTYYEPGDTFAISSNRTLYAQWKEDPNISYVNSYSSDFESSEGYTASSTYNSTVDSGPNGKQWHIYYGTASTNAALEGSQSLQMRWYASAKNNKPYAQTSFASAEVKTISFKYKVTNSNMNFKTLYKENAGDEWIDIETVDTVDNNPHEYRHVFDSSVTSLFFRVEVCGTAPESSSYNFVVDSMRFKSLATLASINGNDTVKVGSEWAPTSITEDDSDAPVTGATYAFVNSNGATILSSNTTTGAFTCSSEGTVTVKATKTGYLIADKVVTVQPADAFVNNLSKTSVEAYTGQHETITFSYGGLDTIGMQSNDESVVTYQDLSYSTGSGSVRLNYVGAGSTTVLFKDGSTTLATITVSVQNSTVTISGLPSSKSIYVGRSFDLGRTISVTHTGTYSNNVNWNSDNNAVASVTNAGVVTAVAVGTANITVASVDAPSVTMTCSVTVAATPKAVIIDFGNVKNQNPNDLTTSTFLSTFSVDSKVSCTAITKVCATNSTNMLKMGSGSYTASLTLKMPSMYYITKVEMEVYEGAATNLEVQSGAVDSEKESQSAATAGTYIFDNNLAADRSSVVTISTSATKAIYLTSLILHYEDRVSNVSTQTQLSYRYTGNSEDGFTYSDISIRFGGVISKALWNELDTDEHAITGFGVMIADGGAVTTHSEFVDILDAATPSTVSTDLASNYAIDYFVPVANMATTIGEDANNYFWNLRFSIDASDMDEMYSAIAYIKVGNEYVLMNMARESVETLALDYLVNRGCTASTAEGSLQAIVDNAA